MRARSTDSGASHCTRRSGTPSRAASSTNVVLLWLEERGIDYGRSLARENVLGCPGEIVILGRGRMPCIRIATDSRPRGLVFAQPRTTLAFYVRADVYGREPLGQLPGEPALP